jgi:RHS repeat-associated protein
LLHLTCFVPSHFTGKERDTESGNDYFGARYYASSMGRFISPDPVVITPERLLDPQQLNQYAYVRNSPLTLVDPTGKILQLSGVTSAGIGYLCIVAGDACDHLSYDQDTGRVSFDSQGVDLSKNEGAAAINDLVQSTHTYDLSIGIDVETKQGTLTIDHVADLDNQNSHAPSKDFATPRPGVDDQIAINNLVHPTSNTGLKPAGTDTLVFHEMAEAYAKVDHGKAYLPAHQEAIDREQKLRDQRPYLKKENPGSGPGDTHHQYQNEVIIKK